jgi:soluble lytic murein transglycosylase-like protein
MSAKSAPQLSTTRRLRTPARHLPATLLVLALCLLVSGAGWRLDLATEPVGASAEMPIEKAAVAEAPEAALPEPVPTPAVRDDARLAALAEFLARRYKVSQAVTLDLVGIAHAAGQQMGLDPLLIIAVMAVESSFNPIAESVAGAKGLMQVIPRYHGEKLREFGGEKAVFDPETNILVGAQILKEYLARTGNMTQALQMYAGALRDRNVVYTGRVLTEKQRLQQVLRNSPQRPATWKPDRA